MLTRPNKITRHYLKYHTTVRENDFELTPEHFDRLINDCYDKDEKLEWIQDKKDYFSFQSVWFRFLKLESFTNPEIKQFLDDIK